ncbi:hypothetical protein O6H91_15G027900 [Diphasiastrum complanatum]|uniref:Uncharacterized protein n=2 Tax=Diphasiastrum complanatum TaxID=34168 RepID=A0ACC2BGP1_DIPCM|nr:hypothetical protein O6H91_15G027900 [Diphasiastrum complanatum]
MVNRWSGIVGGYCSGSKTPSRVLASLCLSPSSQTLMQVPKRNAIFFVGDRVQETHNAVIKRLSQLENIAAIMVSKLGPHVNVWVVEPSRYRGSFACYDNFLPCMTSLGEPTSYKPQGFPAATACLSLLASCIKEVTRHLTKDARQKKMVNTSESGDDATMMRVGEFPETTLFGFSKGGVVLNQLLSELTVEDPSKETARKPYDGTMLRSQIRTSNSRAGNHEDTADSAAKFRFTENSTGTSCYSEDGSSDCIPESHLIPTSIKGFLGSIDQIHFVDVGLNRQGAYITDPYILDGVAKVAKSRQAGISLTVHGTPRQWNDLNRPWILAEKDKFITGLQAAAKKNGDEKLQVFERLYFPERSISLQMHFEIMEALIVN